MSCDVGENTNLKERRRKCWLSTFYRIIFGCIAKNKSHVKFNKTYTSIAIQCKLGNDVERTDFIGDGILLESKAKLDTSITVGNDDIFSQTEEFKTSLNKLDNLINTLSEIQSIYKNKASKGELILNSANKVGDSENNKKILNLQEKEHLLNLNTKTELANNLSEEEILKFNINFDENTFIQCHTNRGKHSLKIIQNSGHKNYNPLILHRCESELLLTKNIDPICKSEFRNRKSSSEMCCHLQKSHTLSAKFGNILNLSSFKKNLVEHMTNIKEDVKTLRNILYSIECLTKKEAMPVLPIYFREIRKWFSERETEIMYNIGGDNLRNDFVKLEDSRYVEAKIRATNFCKFYTLTKSSKTKSKWEKYKKNLN